MGHAPPRIARSGPAYAAAAAASSALATSSRFVRSSSCLLDWLRDQTENVASPLSLGFTTSPHSQRNTPDRGAKKSTWAFVSKGGTPPVVSPGAKQTNGHVCRVLAVALQRGRAYRVIK